MKEKMTFKELLQDYIDNQFSKRLRLNFNNRFYDIAIRQDQIPKIKDIKIEDSGFIVIKFNDNNCVDFKENIKRNTKGEIDELKIDANLINSNDYIKIFKNLISNNKSLPENDKDQILIKHKDKRFIHAVSNFIKDVKKEDFVLEKEK